MEQTREAIAQKLAERLCWQAARRDDARVARRLYRKQVVDGGTTGQGALLDDFSTSCHAGVVDRWVTSRAQPSSARWCNRPYSCSTA